MRFAALLILRVQPRGVVLDPQHVVSVELLAADERVLALLESEAQEISRRDELRLPRLADEAVDGRFGLRRLRRRIAGGLALALLVPAFALLLLLEKLRLVLPPVVLADGDAVEFHGTPDEVAVA